MAAISELTINVSGNKSNISSPLYLYMGDGDITLLITLNKFNVRMGSYSSVTNIVEEFESKWARICILKPDSSLVINDKCEVKNGVIVFVIKKGLIDEIGEIGKFSLQIHLYDGEGDNANRFTIPPVTFELLKPLCDIGHDNGISVAITGTSHVNAANAAYGNETELESFLEDGSYNKTTWVTGDLITASKLNKIENCLYGITTGEDLKVLEFATDLTLTINNYQYIELGEEDLNITLPLPAFSDEKIHEIHLYIKTGDNVPNVSFINVDKWQKESFLVTNTIHEYVFTWLSPCKIWIGGFIKYS